MVKVWTRRILNILSTTWYTLLTLNYPITTLRVVLVYISFSFDVLCALQILCNAIWFVRLQGCRNENFLGKPTTSQFVWPSPIGLDFNEKKGFIGCAQSSGKTLVLPRFYRKQRIFGSGVVMSSCLSEMALAWSSIRNPKSEGARRDARHPWHPSLWACVYTAILYRAIKGPEQGFPCVLILKGKNLFSLEGTPIVIEGIL